MAKTFLEKLSGLFGGNKTEASAPAANKGAAPGAKIQIVVFTEIPGHTILVKIQALGKPLPDLNMVYTLPRTKEQWSIGSFSFGAKPGEFAKGLFMVTMEREGGHTGTLNEGDVLEFSGMRA